MSALRILHVTESLGTGGAERNLLMVLQRSPPDIENHLAYYRADEPLRDAFAAHATLHRLGEGARWELPRSTLRLRALAQELSVDIVHTQLLVASFMGRIGALGLPCKVLTTVQSAFYDGDDFGRFGKLTKTIIRTADRITVARNDRLIAVSAYVKKHVCSELGVAPDAIETIANCLDPSRLIEPTDDEKKAVRAELNLGTGPVLVHVGRLMTEKGQDEAIAAMPEILKNHPSAKLLLVGPGPYLAGLQALVARLGLQASVVFAGRRSDVPLLLHASDLFVFPSRREGLSVAIVEGLAAGLPAIVCDIPQNREVGETVPTCRFVPPGRPNEIAQAALTFLADKGIRERARIAGQEVAARFSANRLAAQFFDLCRSLTARLPE